MKILCYFCEKPLILNFNEISESFIYKTMQLYQQPVQNKIKFVVQGLCVDVDKFYNFHIFRNVQDLAKINSDLCGNLIKRSSFLLQGRRNFLLEEFLKIYEEFAAFTTPKDLFRMLKTTQLEDLDPHYIPRSVVVTLLDIETVFDYCQKSKDLVVIDFNGTFEHYKEILETKLIKVIEMKTLQSQPLQSIDVISATEDCSKKYFDQICQNCSNRHVHYFKVSSENYLLLIMSSKNIVHPINFHFRKDCLDEDSIHSTCDGPINILNAQPGMGKSTLMKSLKNRCPWNMWALYVELKVHNSYLKEKHNSEELLDRFIEFEDQNDSFVKKLKKLLVEKRKLLILLDGLDEIENVCVDNVLKHVKNLSSMGYRFWLSSRQNLQQKLEDYFNIFSMEITGFSQEQQKLYVEKRLRPKYEDGEIEEIILKIFANIVNNLQILGVPLQLKIITEILLNERRHYENFNENLFVLTKLYKAFFDGRYRYSLEKMESKNPHLAIGELEDTLEDYEIAAIQSLFNDDVIRELNLDLRRNQRYLEKIKNRKDSLGIIIKVNSESRAIFEHTTFAEYFASVFLVNNFDKAKVLQRHLFSEEYENLFLIFNIMLSEDNSFHLAVIYKDIEQIKRYVDDLKLDKGGRNVLHLVNTHSKRLPHLEVTRLDNFEYITCNYTWFLSGDVSEGSREIFEYLIESFAADPFENDRVFALSSLEYSLAMGSLYFFERMLKKYRLSEDVIDVIWKYFDEINAGYYSFKFGYPKLLELILSKNNSILNTLIEVSSKTFYSSDSVLRLVFLPECANKMEIINLLLDDYKSKQNKGKGTLLKRLVGKIWHNKDTNQSTRVLELLHFASREGDITVINILLEENVDINLTTSYQETPLHFAVYGTQISAVSLLLEKGAYINPKNKDEETPLHFAAKSGNTEIMALLLHNGADLQTKNRVGKSVLASAACRGYLDAVTLLVEKGAHYDATILHDAVGGGNIKIIEMFLNKGIDVDSRNQMGETPLFVAVCLKTKKVLELLIEKGADVRAVSNHTGTILHKVLNWANYDDATMIGALLDKIDVNLLYVSDDNGATPLHLAVHKGNVEAVKLLLKKGIDLDQIDAHNQKYPLHSAVIDGHLVVPLLLELTQ